MKIGKYKITGLLGKGGMGRVYKVLLPDIGKISALKLLRPHEHMLRLLGPGEIEKMFIKEARILARLRHPNVASVLDFDRDQYGRPFFVMEYHCMNLGLMIGEHYLMERMTRMINPARVYSYSKQLLNGLDRLHNAGILHRDIKPYNVLITEADEVRIIDFGLSLLRGEKMGAPGNLKIGTPFYAAPEQEEAPDLIDERADLYGAGVMMWRMLTGCLPPDAGKRPRPGSLNTLLGTCWDDFLLKAVSLDPEKRFSGCIQMIEALDVAYQDWHENLEKECRVDLPETFRHEAEAGGESALRKSPLKVPLHTAREVFGLDEIWRPVRAGTGKFSKAGPGIVRDSAYGRIWQEAGSRYPVDRREALEYIEILNSDGFAGIYTWRLPTVNELITQIMPVSVLGDYCAAGIFETGRPRLWSADRKSYTTAWFVDTELGYAGPADFNCLFYVRAVSDRF